MSLKLTLALIGFFLIFVFLLNFDSRSCIEGFNGQGACPDVLVQKDAKIYLFNSRKAEIPGINPIEFRNLEEYTEFLEWQKSQGIECPVLFLQKTYDPQGNGTYRIRPSPFDSHAGIPPINMNEPVQKLLDATRDDPPFNKCSHPGFDPKNQRVGLNTELDRLHEIGRKNDRNLNAMDPNWKA